MVRWQCVVTGLVLGATPVLATAQIRLTQAPVAKPRTVPASPAGPRRDRVMFDHLPRTITSSLSVLQRNALIARLAPGMKVGRSEYVSLKGSSTIGVDLMNALQTRLANTQSGGGARFGADGAMVFRLPPGTQGSILFHCQVDADRLLWSAERYDETYASGVVPVANLHPDQWPTADFVASVRASDTVRLTSAGTGGWWFGSCEITRLTK